MATITHQEIADRIEALSHEHSAAYQAEQARIRKERGSLQELCGGVGHVLAKDRSVITCFNVRVCAICGATEPKA